MDRDRDFVESPTPAPPARARRFGPTLAIPLLFWGAFAIFTGLNTYVSMLSHGHSVLRILAYQLSAFAFWAATTPLIAWLARRFPLVPLQWRSVGIHAATAAALTTTYAAWAIVLMLTIKPFDAMTITTFLPHFWEYLAARLPMGMLAYLGTLGVVYAFQFYARSKERAIRAAQLEHELSRARLEALANQLRPHFLFNALHTVSGLIRGGEPGKAISTIAGLSQMLRYALDHEGEAEVAMRDELEIARCYLEIQGLRYGERLDVTLDVAPETLGASVPRLLLQPLIENTIRHGVAVTAGHAWLSLRAARENGSLCIEIRNGTPAAPRAGDGSGIGLRNTRARLQQLYGDGFEMQTRQLEDRFELKLGIPWRLAIDTEPSRA